MKFGEHNNTRRVPVNPENIVRMPSGLLGFEEIKEYVLLANPEEAPFQWLQVVNDDNLAFLVVNPFLVCPDYQPDIPDAEVAALNLKDQQDALVYNIVTLRSGGRATVNLKGPIVINRTSLVAKQIVPNNAADYDLQYPLPVSQEF